jgi:hypothetical protein
MDGQIAVGTPRIGVLRRALIIWGHRAFYYWLGALARLDAPTGTRSMTSTAASGRGSTARAARPSGTSGTAAAGVASLSRRWRRS